MTEAEGKAASLLALRAFAGVWCLRSLADVAIPFYRWAWGVQRIGSVLHNGGMLLVAMLSLLATLLLLRARPRRDVRIALGIAAAMLAVSVVPLFVYVAVDAAGSHSPTWVHAIVGETGSGTVRFLELVPLAGALAVARKARIDMPRRVLGVPLVVVVLDAIALTDFRLVFYRALAQPHVTRVVVDAFIDFSRWSLPLAVGLSLLGRARSALGDHGEEGGWRAQLALGSWILAVLVAYASLAPLFVSDPTRPPWWLPRQASMVFVSDLFVGAFALLVGARACAWAAGVSAFAVFLESRAMMTWWMWWLATGSERFTSWESVTRTWLRGTISLVALTIALGAVVLHRMARAAERRVLARIAVAAGALLLVRVVTCVAGDPHADSSILWKMSLGAELVAQGLLAGVAYTLRHRPDDHVDAEVFTTTMDGEVD